ncbi:MAG: hypothetical protein HYV09_20560 [Deltaproteobacteria bacterium]|nr:hypothetical protein [Deltaproteobacteria bacterium]
MASMRRVLLAGLLVVSGACGGRLLATDDGATTSGVTPLPACATGAAPTEPVCGQELTSCDPMHPQGLPVGACSAGATCDVTVRAACACADEPGPRFPWRCACPAGTWACELMPPDARVCLNACLDAGPPDPGDATPSDVGPSDVGPSDGGPVTCPKPKAVAPPGPRLTAETAKGSGVCAGRTLGQAIDAAYAAMPSLKDITVLYDPEKVMSDGSFVHAFQKPDGGFAIVFKRGGGDCPAGCTENEYWYFETDAACATKQVGHYLPTWGSGCVNVVGAPLGARRRRSIRPTYAAPTRPRRTSPARTRSVRPCRARPAPTRAPRP